MNICGEDWFNSVQWFQRRRFKCEKLMDGRHTEDRHLAMTKAHMAYGQVSKKSANQQQELSLVAMFDNRSGQNEQSLERTFHRCFLPTFTSFGGGVSEEKIKIEKLTDDRRWTTYAMRFQRRRF